MAKELIENKICKKCKNNSWYVYNKIKNHYLCTNCISIRNKIKTNFIKKNRARTCTKKKNIL